MAARYLCGHCGMNHNLKDQCPVKTSMGEKQDAVDKAENDDIRRYGNWMLLAVAVTDARKRAEIMARLEAALHEENTW